MTDYSRDLRPAKWGLGVSLRGSNPVAADVRFGSKADIGGPKSMSALPPKADIAERDRQPEVRKWGRYLIF